MTGGIALRHGRSAYPFVTGLVAGTLLVGLLLPFVIDDGETSTTATGALAGDDGAEPGRVDAGRETSPVDAEVSNATTADGSSPSTGDGGSALAAGGDAASSAGAPARVRPAGSTTLTASDRGVTAAAVKVGILLFDIGSIGRVGIGVPGASVEEQRRAWQTAVAVANDAGGVGGRKLQPVFATYDLLSETSKQAACLALTEDEKVFTVLEAGGYSGAPLGCIVDQHQTPMLVYANQGAIRQYYRSGRLFSMFPVAERQMTVMAAEFDALGLLDGKKLGILSDDQGDGRLIADALEAALARLGHDVAHRTDFDADTATGASQVPVEVNQMRAAGVEVILEITNGIFSAQFAQGAESQGYRPTYLVTDLKNGTTDTHTQNWPTSLDGSVGVTAGRFGETAAGIGEAPAERRCREAHTAKAGEPLERGSNYYGIVMRACGLTRLFTTAATHAGAALTRPRLVGSLERLTEVIDPVLLGVGTFGRDRHDAADVVRTLRWQAPCRCWRAASAPRRARE